MEVDELAEKIASQELKKDWDELEDEQKEKLREIAKQHLEAQAKPAEPPPPQEENIPVKCGNCQKEFNFKVSPADQSFGFTCSHCGAKNHWTRGG